jgi:iron complex outermembrane receptor protein
MSLSVGGEFMNIDTRALHIACSTIALVCAAAAAPAWAQTQTEDASSEDADQVAGASDEIVVTGSNITGVKQVGTEAIVITREEAEKTGHTTPAELLRTLPQVRTGEYDREGGRSTTSLQNAAGSNSVTLRGLGSTSSTTLILVNGRRTVGTGSNTSAVDANQLPFAAIERVEVLADGASAIYGSDAIGGVINYILRKDYEGLEVSLRGGNTFGGFETAANGTGGVQWDDVGGLGRGNLMISYDYAHRDPYRAGKNPYLRSDLSPLGGIDQRLNGANASVGFIPSIVVTPPTSNPPAPQNPTLPQALTSVYYGVPAGSTGPLTASQLLLNQPALTDLSYFTDYIGRQNRHQAAIYFNQELGDSVDLFVDARYTNRETVTRTTQGFGGGALTVALRSKLRDASGAVTSVDNPNYVFGVPGVSQGAPGGFVTIPGIPFPIPVPATPAADLTVLYPALKDTGPRQYIGSDESFNVTAGARVKLFSDWEAEASYTIGRNKGCTYCIIGGFINSEAFQYQIDIGAINPLSTAPLTAAQLATFTGTQKQIGHNGLDDLIVKFNGSLFELPGGKVKAAFGGERSKVFNWNENTSVAGRDNVRTVITDKGNSYYDRTITSAFGELYLPLISDDMNIPLVDSFVVSGAVRYDKYSDAGESTNPKLGFTWEVSDFLSFAGTWGTSFRSPSITDKNPSAYVSGFITPFPVDFNNQDPRISNILCFGPGTCFTQIGVLLGSNPDLKPERSTNWSLSAQLKPGAGFKAGVTYYNIDYKDRLVFPNVLAEFPLGPTPGSNPLSYRGYESYVIPINNPASCVNTNIASADPALQPYLSTPIYSAGSGVGQLGGFADFCSIRALLDSRFTNLSRTKTDGLDVNVAWDGEVGDVRINAAAAVNVILNYDEQVKPDVAPTSRLGFLGTPVKWRGRGNLGVNWRGASATLFANYTGSFINDQARSAPLGSIAPNQKVPSYTTFDLNLGYGTNFEGRRSPISTLRYSVTIQNLFNDYPPRVFQSDRVIADVHGVPYGRTVAFQITAGF